MHSFYIEKPVDDLAALPPEEAKHALKVLRLRAGDGVCAMDGAGAMGESAASASLLPGEAEITANVTVTYVLK